MFSMGKAEPRPYSRTLDRAGMSCVVVTNTFTQLGLKQENIKNKNVCKPVHWRAKIDRQIHGILIKLLLLIDCDMTYYSIYTVYIYTCMRNYEDWCASTDYFLCNFIKMWYWVIVYCNFTCSKVCVLTWSWWGREPSGPGWATGRSEPPSPVAAGAIHPV